MKFWIIHHQICIYSFVLVCTGRHGLQHIHFFNCVLIKSYSFSNAILILGNCCCGYCSSTVGKTFEVICHIHLHGTHISPNSSFSSCSSLIYLSYFYLLQVPMFTASGLRVRFLKVSVMH